MYRFIPIIKHEFKKIKWSVLYITFIMYMHAISYKSTIENEILSTFNVFVNTSWAEVTTSLIFPGYIFPFLMIVPLIYCQFNEKNNSFLFSLPYTKKEMLTAKLLCGIFSFSIIFLIYSIYLSFCYNQYSFVLDNLLPLTKIEGIYDLVSKFALMKNILFVWLLTLCTYIFLVFFQMIVKNSIVSILFALMFSVVPSFILMCLEKILNVYSSILSDIGTKMMIPFFATSGFTRININPKFEVSRLYYKFMINIDYIENIFSKSIILIILTCIFLFFSYFAYKREEQMLNSSLILFNFTKKCFIVLSVICISLLFGFYTANLFERSKILLILVMVISSIVSFIVSKKFIDITSSTIKEAKK